MNELADFQYKQFTTFNYPINSFSLLEVGRQNKPRASKIEPASTSTADDSASDRSSHTLDSRSVQCGDTNNPRNTHFSYPLQPIHSITIKNNPNHSSWSSFGGINPWHVQSHYSLPLQHFHHPHNKHPNWKKAAPNHRKHKSLASIQTK